MALGALGIWERPRALRVDGVLRVQDRVEPLCFPQQPVCVANRGLFVVFAVHLQRGLVHVAVRLGLFDDEISTLLTSPASLVSQSPKICLRFDGWPLHVT